jgi:hypothetical protein
MNNLRGMRFESVLIYGGENGAKSRGMSWLRGKDLNLRPLGYERADVLLSSSLYGASGIARNRK